jgi:hypothetical protein
MNINRIGKASVSTPNCNLNLNNVIHVPSAQMNLIYVHRLTADINVFLEFHLDFFLSRIKPRGKLFWKASVEVFFILFLSCDMKLTVPSSSPWRVGIID